MANKSGIHINKSHKGAFTKKAKAAGMSVQEFAKHVHAHPDNYSGSTCKQANFARVAKTKFKHQTGGTSLPDLENTNPGMQPIQALNPSMPTFNMEDNITPYAEPMMDGQQQQPQQGGRYRRVPVIGNNPYVKGFNEVASVVTGAANAINNGKMNRAERFRLIEGMTPRYMQNMEGPGLNSNPAYTMYGGAGMHGEGTSIGIYDHTDGPNFKQYSRGIESDVADRRTESDVPQPIPAKPGKIPTRYMMGGSMQGGLGWDYDDHVLYMAYGGADFGVPRTYSEMDNEDYGFTGIAHNGPYGHNSVYRAGGTVSSDKAKEILRDGTVHGQALTDKQKRYFGWIAGGRKQFGGWDQEGFMMQTGGSFAPEDYYKASAELSYYKDKLNDQLKAKNPKAFGDYFHGLQGARGEGQQKGFDYIQNSQYNDYLTPDEVKKALGTDKDYNNYLNSLKAVNAYNVKQGQQPLYGNIEGENDPSKLNYGRRFASLQVTPSFGQGVRGSYKHYGRQYQYNPETGQVDFTEQGDLSLRPQGFSVPATSTTQTTPPADIRVSSRKYGGKKYTAGRSFMTSPAMQFGGEGFAIGDEIEMSEEMLKNLKKQGYKFETI